MNRLWKWLIVLGCTTVLLLGCAGREQALDTKQHDATTIEKLNETSREINKEIQKLLSLKQAGVKKPAVYESPEEGPLAQRVNFLWSGPVEPALRSLAQQADYRLKVVGRQPLQPKVVMVDARQVPIFDVIQNIGWQVGETVGIGIKKSNRTIVLLYKVREVQGG